MVKDIYRLNTYAGVFSAYMHDVVIKEIGRLDGIYMRANRCLASELKATLEFIPQHVPVVYDISANPHRIEFREASSGELLAEIEGLPLPRGVSDE